MRGLLTIIIVCLALPACTSTQKVIGGAMMGVGIIGVAGGGSAIAGTCSKGCDEKQVGVIALVAGVTAVVGVAGYFVYRDTEHTPAPPPDPATLPPPRPAKFSPPMF